MDELSVSQEDMKFSLKKTTNRQADSHRGGSVHRL